MWAREICPITNWTHPTQSPNPESPPVGVVKKRPRLSHLESIPPSPHPISQFRSTPDKCTKEQEGNRECDDARDHQITISFQYGCRQQHDRYRRQPVTQRNG